MEAVCYFCLCAITQYRLKKSNASSQTNRSSFSLLENTYDLLKFINMSLVKPGNENEVFQKKFKVLSNWIESFINRCFYVMYIKESSILRDTIKQYQHQPHQASSQQQQQSSQPHQQSSSQQQTGSGSQQQSTSRSSAVVTSTTSPQNEPPPPSPASSVGSTNSNPTTTTSSTAAHHNTGAHTATASNVPVSSSSTSASSSSNINPKLFGLYEKFFKFTESNVKSQMIWETNENQINEIKYLSDFRDIIKQQVQRDLHLDSEAEVFAGYVISGLQLFKLNNFSS